MFSILDKEFIIDKVIYFCLNYIFKNHILIIIKYFFKSLVLISTIYIMLESKKNLIILLNQTNFYKTNNIIKLAIYSHSLNNGGVERNTAILLNYISTIELFEIYLFTDIISNNEYKISNKIKRVIISYKSNYLKRQLLKNKINILIYQFYDKPIIEMLKKIRNLKIILYNHSCFLFWIYTKDRFIFKNVYNEYKKSNYVISIVPFENDFLFKKWGIKSIFMDNFLTYDYNKVIKSDLSSNNILMIGRGSDENKRFYLGIRAMKYILKEIQKSQMIVISDDKDIKYIKKIVKFLNLENNINFVGYSATPEIYFKNASLHIFPTIAEACPMVLSETKIYGIPNILVGIDYVSNIKGGVVIVYDDDPEIIAKYAIKILTNEQYKKTLSKEARKSMKKFNNNILFKKWVELLMAINNEDTYNFYFNKNKLSKNESLYILKNQINLLRKRIPSLENINIKDILNFSFIENINYI